MLNAVTSGRLGPVSAQRQPAWPEVTGLASKGIPNGNAKDDRLPQAQAPTGRNGLRHVPGFLEQVAELREQERDIDLLGVLVVFKDRAVEAGKERDRLGDQPQDALRALGALEFAWPWTRAREWLAPAQSPKQRRLHEGGRCRSRPANAAGILRVTG